MVDRITMSKDLARSLIQKVTKNSGKGDVILELNNDLFSISTISTGKDATTAQPDVHLSCNIQIKPEDPIISIKGLEDGLVFPVNASVLDRALNLIITDEVIFDVKKKTLSVYGKGGKNKTSIQKYEGTYSKPDVQKRMSSNTIVFGNKLTKFINYRKAFQPVLLAAETKSNRPLLRGVNVSFEEGQQLKAVATNTHRVHQKHLPHHCDELFFIENEKVGPKLLKELEDKKRAEILQMELTVSAASLKFAFSFFNDNDNVLLQFSDGMLAINGIDGSTKSFMFVRLLEGKYPDVKRIVDGAPLKVTQTVTVDKKKLEEELTNVKIIIASEKQIAVTKFSFVEGNKQIGIDVGIIGAGVSYSSAIDLETTITESITLSLSPSYLLDLIANFEKSEKLNIGIASDILPVVVGDASDSKEPIGLLTPIRLK